jgi:hypothetical protein
VCKARVEKISGVGSSGDSSGGISGSSVGQAQFAKAGRLHERGSGGVMLVLYKLSRESRHTCLRLARTSLASSSCVILARRFSLMVAML